MAARQPRAAGGPATGAYTAFATPPVDGLLAQVDQLDRALSAIDVARALATLTPVHRRVIQEIYYRHHTVSETAATLGIPAGTVKTRTYYALRALRRDLERRGVTSAGVPEGQHSTPDGTRPPPRVIRSIRTGRIRRLGAQRRGRDT